ncbi:molybdopterin-synthase adenylyltransferase MoeB [Rapidithrix thailandica]|uniref:Molybdopterin-synthase adenylyltransferase n=1 Tax=Rapidithrix thailandica TaxID=413964 RepID=A0AAW9S4T5_9BACT
MLTKEEKQRYSRHLILPEFGEEAQLRLKQSNVLIVGAGGLGCPVLQYLTAAGVGKIGIVDFDEIQDSNLQRQVLYTTEHIGRKKAEVAREILSLQNPYVQFTTYLQPFTSQNALEIVEGYDLVVDCTDNFATRYLINDVCVLLNKPYIYGAIFKFEGQVSVFNYTDENGAQGPTYRCLFPAPPSPGEVPSCAEIGVIGVLPGYIGMLQANEAVKVLTGIGKVLNGELMVVDLLEMSTQKFVIQRNPESAKVEGLIDYEEFCGVSLPQEPMKTLTVQELEEKLSQGEAWQLLDVRELYEFEICHLEHARLIPMQTVSERLHEVDKEKPTVVYCHHGGRSAHVVQELETKYGYKNLYNLEGGIHAWAMLVDDEMETY